MLIGWVLARRAGVAVPPPLSVVIARDTGGYLSGLARWRQGDVPGAGWQRPSAVPPIRSASTDELLAFARGFRVPITWFFTPPSPSWDSAGVSTPDAGDDGLDPLVMLHAVLGTPETLADYKDYLLSWPDPRHRMRINPDGTTEQLGRVAEDVHPMLDDLLRLRARKQLRDRFGDVDQGRDVLRALTALLDELDDPTFDEPARDEPAASDDLEGEPGVAGGPF